MDRADAFSDEDAAAQSAVDAAQYSYSPITNGCNVENAIYEAAHAESTALTAGVCRGYRHLVAMFVACPDLPVDSSLELSAPCGFCRQWMTEFVAPGDDVHVFLVARRSSGQGQAQPPSRPPSSGISLELLLSEPATPAQSDLTRSQSSAI